ncbi:PilZ domain-containing protein [Novosphingobium sp.]|jgi:bifunctional pyridoxal-dependent enzyme with beta-cystathionase and maltose regulon repressor activities|uniref:PilZ domain-containing protein n=1 Tax=Novosphingobium sp. TaxID=1874826 RepID=UPI0031D39649
METPTQSRKVNRLPVTLAAKCRTMGGMRDEAYLCDISTHGCKMVTRSLYLSIGMRVTIKPDGMEAISGVVRWLSQDGAGIEFDSPLYAPVVENLGVRHARH